MKTAVEPLEGNKVKLSGEVDEAEFDGPRTTSGRLRQVARRAGSTDNATIDLTVTTPEGEKPHDGQNELYEIGTGRFGPVLDARLEGAKVGDILDFNGPEASDDLRYRVLVKDIKEKVLPEVTDEWAGEASEF